MGLLLIAGSALSCATNAPPSAEGTPETYRTDPAPVPEIGPAIEPGIPDPAAFDSAAVDREVREFLDESARAWNRDDLDAFVATYTDSAGLTFVGGAEVVRDREQLRQNYSSSWFSGASEPPDLRFSDVEVRPLSARHALAFGRWTLYLPGFEVQTRVGTGWFTLLLERTASGWVIVHDHSSSLDE